MDVETRADHTNQVQVDCVDKFFIGTAGVVSAFVVGILVTAGNYYKLTSWLGVDDERLVGEAAAIAGICSMILCANHTIPPAHTIAPRNRCQILAISLCVAAGVGLPFSIITHTNYKDLYVTGAIVGGAIASRYVRQARALPHHTEILHLAPRIEIEARNPNQNDYQHEAQTPLEQIQIIDPQLFTQMIIERRERLV